MRRFPIAVLCLGFAACSSRPAASPAPDANRSTTSTAAVPTSGPIVVALQVERQTGDPATAEFAATVRATLLDPRGWSAAGFDFVFADDAPYRIVLADGPVVDRLCRPYAVGGRFSCQNGPVVALNADRWRTATPQWTGDLAGYRQMLINHEVGHLLGQHHPAVQCPAPGLPAPVMAQQSTELDGCTANPWPLPAEIACAASHTDPLAPPFDEHPVARCRP